MKRKLSAVAVVALTGLLSCKSDVLVSENEVPMVPEISVSSAVANADMLSRAIAIALRDPSQRKALREAFRASPLTEHKLVLQDFVQTPVGQSLLDAGALQSEVSIGDLMTIVSSLPPLDFYVSSRKHRREWDGNGSVVVGAALGSSRAELDAYNPSGIVRHVTQDNWESGPVVILLHPAERKSNRLGPQPSKVGDPIESPYEGTLSGSWGRPLNLPAGLLNASLDLNDLVPRRLDECGENCGGSMTPTDTTFLEHLIVIHVCDNGNCSEGNEFEWHTYFSVNSGSTWTDRTDIRREGVSSDTEETLHIPAIFKKPRTSSQMIQSDVVETDFWSGDDHFGSPQWHVSESGFLKSEGATRCGYARPYGGTYDCGTPYFWAEVNQTMLWHNF